MTLRGWLDTLAQAARTIWDAVRGKRKGQTPTPTTPSRWLRWPWWLPCLVLLLSCALPDEPTTAPEPDWLAAWTEAEACSGRTGDVTRIRWHLVDDAAPVMRYGKLGGHQQGRDIYLARSYNWRWIARHEALHALGYGGHPPDIFETRCHATFADHRDTLET